MLATGILASVLAASSALAAPHAKRAPQVFSVVIGADSYTYEPSSISNVQVGDIVERVLSPGMVFAINPDTNGTQTFAAYQSAAMALSLPNPALTDAGSGVGVASTAYSAPASSATTSASTTAAAAAAVTSSSSSAAAAATTTKASGAAGRATAGLCLAATAFAMVLFF
ncbi:hypothetical protein MNV49_005579 [Pseudohyphozyma bogoriensis]|nr:hypothetical protein MNV49_005579 [Pseudohyphozyma bogoriensis]